VSGLPVAAFYRADGQPRTAAIQQKRDSLTLPVVPRGLPHSPPPEKVSVEFHQVIPEALAAWYDHVIVTQDDGVTLDADRLNAPVAVVDIGGRTTDYVVVQDQGVVHAASGSLEEGMLNVTARVAAGIEVQFAVEGLGE